MKTQDLDSIYKQDLSPEQRNALEKLTREQVIAALGQAIACGDFTRLIVQGSNKQGVVYIPFEREQELLGAIAQLKKENETLNCGAGERTPDK